MHHERESQIFHILSLPHTMTLSDAGKLVLTEDVYSTAKTAAAPMATTTKSLL